MKVRYALIVMLCCLTLGAKAESIVDNVGIAPRDTVATIVTSYIDSLKIFRKNQNSMHNWNQSSNSVEGLEGKYYRLFAPLTFYYNIAQRQFDIAADTLLDEPDRTLLDIYMKRPDLVLGSQKNLDESGTLREPIHTAVTPDVDIIEMVAPTPTETDVAPIDIIVKKPNFWKFSGNFGLQMYQNYVSSNWYQGGESNYSALFTAVLMANYNNQKGFIWENKLELKLGLLHTSADTVHSVKISEDMLKYTGKIGVQATSKWYYTFQLIAETQMMRSFNTNSDYVYRDFLSPLSINPSIGMDYKFSIFKNRLTGSAHLAPFASTMKYCDRGYLATRYGIEEGKHFNINYGSEININFRWNIVNGISWSGRIYGYTTYDNSRMEFENTFSFAINKYLNSNLFIYPRFDDSRARDDHHGYWHFKEYLSLGLSYSI